MAAITTGVIVAASAVYSGVQNRKAAKATQRSQRLQQRMADLAAARERRRALQGARVQRASIEAQGANTGLVGSSAAAAAIADVTTRTNENLSFMDQSANLARQATTANQQAAGYASKAAMGESVSSLAKQAYSIYG